MDRQSISTVRSKTAHLYADPHNPFLYLERGFIFEDLGFSDLAAADAYRALTLLDSVVDPDGCEFHARRQVTPTNAARSGGVTNGADEKDDADADADADADEDGDDDNGFALVTQDEYEEAIGKAYVLLVRSLVWCGCLRDAYDFCVRGIDILGARDTHGEERKELFGSLDEIRRAYIMRRRRRLERLRQAGECDQDSSEVADDAEVDPSLLPAQGLVRRILYPWNEHEPDRKSPETLHLLNERLREVAPRCEVRAVALPALHASATDNKTTHGKSEQDDVSIQLGLFAKQDIPAGEILLRESSLLTATNRLYDDICDACHGALPSLSAANPPVSCEDCFDTVFCSERCRDLAQRMYHGAICGLEGVESIGKDIPDPTDKADYLYLLLLGRALAMSVTQDVHPLDLPEVKYIWGDFHDYEEITHTTKSKNNNNNDINDINDPTRSLPFSFHLSILQPMRLLEEMGLDPFSSLPRYDTWVLNALYAKFRGTASGRLSTWDGGPEVCAVHPLWCLANHSCDPNVRWEWGGEITFSVRGVAERPVWPGREGSRGDDGFDGIRKDQEVLNHYCDVGLDVKERREWARGALGGWCLCPRCVWESSC